MSKDYAYWVKLAAWLAPAVAITLLALKLYAWWLSDASVMLATATDSLLDLFASLVNLAMLRIALAPADQEHSFGHGKAESLAGLMQAAFVAGSALLLFANGVDNVINPMPLQETQFAIGVTIATIVLTLLLVAVQQMVIARTQSVAISADALHYKGDLFLNLGVLAALVLTDYLTLYADGVFTCLVAGYLLFNAYGISRASVDQLMDRQLEPEQLAQIETLIKQQANILGYHQLKTRRSGNIIFIQCHIELDDNLSLFQAHEIGDELEQALQALLPNAEIMIHHDPASVVVPSNN